jgi:hypothetical protein
MVDIHSGKCQQTSPRKFSQPSKDPPVDSLTPIEDWAVSKHVRRKDVTFRVCHPDKSPMKLVPFKDGHIQLRIVLCSRRVQVVGEPPLAPKNKLLMSSTFVKSNVEIFWSNVEAIPEHS